MHADMFPCPGDPLQQLDLPTSITSIHGYNGQGTSCTEFLLKSIAC